MLAPRSNSNHTALFLLLILATSSGKLLTPSRPDLPKQIYWECDVDLTNSHKVSYAKGIYRGWKQEGLLHTQQNLELVQTGEKQISEDWGFQKNMTLYVHVGNICGRDQSVSVSDFSDFRQFDDQSQLIGPCSGRNYLWKAKDGSLGCMTPDGKTLTSLILHRGNNTETLHFKTFTSALPGQGQFQLPKMCWGF